MIPGESLPAEGEVELNEGRETLTLTVASVGDRPIQVGSHFHFFEVNKALKFDRESAYGMRLNIPAGNAVRFEPGDEREVELVSIGGRRIVRGMNGLTEGRLDDPEVREAALAAGPRTGLYGGNVSGISRRRYGGMFGPTVGDRLRLADTELFIEVEQDLTLAGEEAVFGGGKSIREGMAQGSRPAKRVHDGPRHHKRLDRGPLGDHEGGHRGP